MSQRVTNKDVDDLIKVEQPSISNGKDYNTVLKRIYKHFMEITNDEKYVDCLMKVIKKAKPSYSALVRIAHAPLDDDSKYYRTSKINDTIGLREDPHCTDTWQPGVPLNRQDAKFVAKKCFTIKAPRGKYSESFIGTGCDDNEHIDTSIVKRLQSCVIKMNNFCAQSLTNQMWLNNNGSGTRVLTGAFVAQYFEDVFPLIEQYGYSVLLTVEDYTKGLHLGNEYCYYCDEAGYVLGYSRGTCTPWTDKTNDIPNKGNFNGSYEVETLYNIGPQRLVFLKKNKVEYCVPARSNVVHTYKGEGENLPPLTPRYQLNLCQPESDETKSDLKVILPEYENKLLNIYQGSRFDQLCKKFDDNVVKVVKDRTNQAVAAGSIVASALTFFNKKFAPALAVPPMVLAARYAINWLKTHEPKIQLYPYSPVVEGKHGDEILKLMKENPIDPVTHLPFGYYYIDENNIIQVPQGHPQANYTNNLRLVKFYCEKQKWQKTSYVAIYNETFNCMTPNIESECTNSFFEQQESKIERITSSETFKVNVPRSEAFGLRLSNHDSLRDYVCSKIDRRTLEAGVASRVLRGGLRSSHTEKEHFDLYSEFWWDNVCTTYPVVDPTPDISHYKGKKYRKYLRKLLDLSHKSLRVAYNSFIKIEVLPSSNLHKKAFRFIVPNDPAFNTAFLNFFHSFEKDLLNVKVHDIPIFAKGKTYEQRWSIINKLAQKYLFCIPIDFKNFDAHHCRQAYTACMRFYASIGLPKKVAHALAYAKTYGVVEHSLPLRRSGDLFTGSGNCLVVGSLLWKFIKEEDIGVFCDGDDTLLFVNDRSIYQRITEHLESYGYEIDDDPCYVDLSEEDFEIPFCQTFYSKQGYYVDTTRLLNKMLNIVAPNVKVAAETILGKLQAVAYLSNLGIEFDIDINSLLNGLELSYDVEYKMHMCESLEHYLIDMSRYKYQLGAPSAGLVGEIVKNLYKHRLRIKLCNPIKRRKVILKIITNVLCKEEARINKLTEQTTKMLARAESIVKSFGLKLATPELAAMYSKMEITHCGSKSYLKFSNPTECTQLQSTGYQDIHNSQEVQSSCPTMLTKLTRTQSSQLVPFLHNNHQESQDSAKTQASKFQAPVGTKPQQEEVAKESTTVISSILDTQSKLMKHLNQSQSGLNTMSLSTLHRSKLSPQPQVSDINSLYLSSEVQKTSENLSQHLLQTISTTGPSKETLKPCTSASLTSHLDPLMVRTEEQTTPSQSTQSSLQMEQLTPTQSTTTTEVLQQPVTPTCSVLREMINPQIRPTGSVTDQQALHSNPLPSAEKNTSLWQVLPKLNAQQSNYTSLTVLQRLKLITIQLLLSKIS